MKVRDAGHGSRLWPVQAERAMYYRLSKLEKLPLKVAKKNVAYSSTYNHVSLSPTEMPSCPREDDTGMRLSLRVQL